MSDTAPAFLPGNFTETHRYDGTYLVSEASFGVLDAKGRTVGCRGEIEPCMTFVNPAAGREMVHTGEWYVRVQSTRDGKKFGATATTVATKVATLEEAKAAALAKMADSFKRVKRAAEKNGGVYKP